MDAPLRTTLKDLLKRFGLSVVRQTRVHLSGVLVRDEPPQERRKESTSGHDKGVENGELGREGREASLEERRAPHSDAKPRAEAECGCREEL